MSNNKIQIRNIKKSFGTNIVLNNISLDMESGHIYGIVGDNGSGKTVLFKCICGLYTIDEGSIIINNKVLGKDIDMLVNAGIIIEEPAYIRNISGYRNLDLLYRINHRADKNKIEEVMRQVGLNPKSKQRVYRYSLGMRQRLAIAQATMEDQEYLILDEPMNGLDRAGVNQMRELFVKKRDEGKIIIMASHNPSDIDYLCDKVYELDKGILSLV